MKKTLLISLSIFVSSLLFLFALTGSKAEKSNDEYLQNIEKIGSDALSEPEFYPKAESVAVDSTEISKLNVVESVAKTLQPEKVMYGFTLKAQSNDDLKGISFVVTKSDDSVSDKYVLNVNEDQVDRDGNPTNKGLSEQYLFSAGIKKIDFYYEGERNFEISYYDFESKDKGLDSIKKLTAISTDPNTVYKTRFFQQAGLNIITRADMGLPADSTFAPGWTPPYYPVNRIVIHHTAGGVDMINPVNTVKAIWRYHAIDNDWGDFGYNYLIDPYGNIYEGRAGINGVRGNHAPPNEGSIGISILGNYTNQQPTQASTASLIRLMAYLAAVNNIDLTHKTTFDGNNPGGVYAHKNIGKTACPGNSFYPLIGAIANSARLVKQTNTVINNKIASINSLVDGREFYTGSNRANPDLLETNILMNIDNLSPELKTKLRNPPTRFAKTTEESDYIMYTLEASQLNQAIRELKLVAPEATIQPNYKYQKAVWTEDFGNARSVPADYNNSIHWNLQQIKAPEAWYYLFNNTTPANHTGSADVTVAVLDTGVAYETYTLDSLEDAFDRSYRVISDLQSTTFVNGYDPSWEFMCDVWAGQGYPCSATELEKINHGNDDDGHGTFVTSIIASQIDSAAPNNILGIAPSVKIMPVKIFLPKIDWMGDDKGATYDSIIINGLDHAITNGADVINMSFGGYNEGDPLFEAKIDEAYNAGIVLVGASGNNNGAVFFPAALDNVIAVGASNYAGTDKANYSNYGPELDVVAPVGSTNVETGVGAATFSCFADLNGPGEYDDGCGQDDDLTLAFLPNGSYMQGYGTSFAAPQVAAQAALIKSAHPSLTNAQIKARIINYANDILTSGQDNYSGHGIIDLANSVSNNLNPHVTNVYPPRTNSLGGDRILILGNNFQEGMKVYFGLNLATKVEFIDSTQVIATTGPHIPAYVAVVVENPNQLTSEINNALEYQSAIFVDIEQYKSTPGGWSINSSKYSVSGDFNGDGLSETAVMYDYGNNNTAINVFEYTDPENPETYTWSQWYRSTEGGWSIAQTKFLVAGDFDGNGKDDIAAMYYYGDNNTAFNIFSVYDPGQPKKFTWQQWYRSTPSGWSIDQTKFITSGDYNNDGRDDIATMYYYGGNTTAFNIFSTYDPLDLDTLTWKQWYRSTPAGWAIDQTYSITSGDYNGNGRDEIAVMYNYFQNTMALNVFANDGIEPNKFTWTQWYRSTPSGWSVTNTKSLVSGNFYYGDSKDELLAIYNYGGVNVGFNVFYANDPINENSFKWKSWYRSPNNTLDFNKINFINSGKYYDNKEGISLMYAYSDYDMGLLNFSPEISSQIIY